MLIALLASVLTTGATAAARVPDPAAIAAGLGAYFDSIEGFSGVVSITMGGQPLFQNAYGEADHDTGRPATLDTAFLIGSISKQFTAAGILVLAQEDRLSTSDSLRDHLDFVPQDKAAITIHHLLTHTSGLPDAYWDQNRDLDREGHLRKEIESADLLGEPGTVFHYSNLNYDLLGLLIERVSGKNYEQFLHERVFQPAGLANTGCSIPKFDDLALYQDPVTEVWTTQGIDVASPVDRPEYFHPIGSGGLFTTVADLHRWHEQLKTDRVLSEESRTAFQSPGMDNYAYGWRVMDLPNGDRAVAHGGFDDSIGVNATFARVIGADVVLIILSNSIQGGFNASDAAMQCYRIMSGG